MEPTINALTFILLLYAQRTHVRAAKSTVTSMYVQHNMLNEGGVFHSCAKSERALFTPSVLLDHMDELDDILPFLVFLTGLKRTLVFPAHGRFAAATPDVRYRV